MNVVAIAAIALLVTLLVASIAHYRYWVRRLTLPLEYVLEEVAGVVLVLSRGKNPRV